MVLACLDVRGRVRFQARQRHTTRTFLARMTSKSSSPGQYSITIMSWVGAVRERPGGGAGAVRERPGGGVGAVRERPR